MGGNDGSLQGDGWTTSRKRGDQDAFARLWRQFQPGLLRYLRVKAGPAAEDLAADTWFRVVRALPTFEGDESGFRGWLFTTARNRLTDWYRKGSRHDEVVCEGSLFTALPATSDVESDAEEHSATDAALALISGLPADQAEAVMLRIVAGLDVSMVASIMERSPGSVRVLCHRGLRCLERSLAAEPVGAGVGADRAVPALPVQAAGARYGMGRRQHG